MVYDQSHKTKISDSMLVLLALACSLLGSALVDGTRLVTANNFESVKHKGTVKTIESDSGDVIDCVEIYKQPAFDHPLLRNHTIEMEPSSTPSGVKPTNNQAKLIQDWFKNGECPEGTIPIIRPQRYDYNWRAPRKLDNSFGDNPYENHEYAKVFLPDGTYYGAHASMNVWTPATYDTDISLAQIWVVSGAGEQLNTIEAGWITHSGRNQIRMFLYWTRDNYNSTGCYNLDCPGFVQTTRKYAVGAIIPRVSSYNGPQCSLVFTIVKAVPSGNWWLQIQGEYIGYWPGSIFTTLSDHSTRITWGGEIGTSTPHGRHTQTEMGSGHFPHEGYGKASYFYHVQYADQPGSFKDATSLIPYATKPLCYDITVFPPREGTSYGTSFFYGGPGYSSSCLT